MNKWVSKGIAIMAASMVASTGCNSETSNATSIAEGTGVNKTVAVDPEQGAEGTPPQGTPPEGTAPSGGEAKDSVIDIVEKVEADVTTTDTDEVELANAFLDTLTDEQKEIAIYELTAENTVHWTNLPANSENRNGVALGDLSDESVEAVLNLRKLP